MNRQTDFFPFTGGENLVDPVILMKAGELHDSLNFENRKNGGYRRIDGYERFDGRTKPSSLSKGDYATEALWIAAVEAARTNITAMAGSGKTRGIWVYKGEKYAFRDNAGETACIMYKATTSGWVAVTMSYLISFTAGTSAIVAGDTITGATSSASGVVGRIIIDSGDWSTSDAVGRIYLNPTPTGTFQSETLNVSGSATATCSGAQAQTSFPNGGSYEFINYNFYGNSDSETMYGVNGEGYGFAFDGTCVWFIKTGMTVDTPSHIFAHKKHLFYSFTGGSIQHSSIGVPEEWNAITGASELAIGQECTGFAHTVGNTMTIFGRNNTSILYGSSSADWDLKSYSLDTGAIEGSIQTMDSPYFLDDRGVKKVSPTMDFGDFEMSTISQKVNPQLDDLRGTLACSLRVRSKNQYRLFYNDGTVIFFVFDNGKLKGVTKCNYGYYDSSDEFHSKIFTYTISAEELSGEEVLYAGDDAGYVYQLDSGNSFDGEEVLSMLKPIFYHFKSPENIKRFMKVVLEIEATEEVAISFTPEFSYGDSFYPPASKTDINVSAGANFWGSATWEDFYWDSQSLSTAYGYMTGIGKNFRMIITSKGTYEAPFTLQGAIIHYTRKGYAK